MRTELFAPKAYDVMIRHKMFDIYCHKHNLMRPHPLDVREEVSDGLCILYGMSHHWIPKSTYDLPPDLPERQCSLDIDNHIKSLRALVRRAHEDHTMLEEDALYAEISLDMSTRHFRARNSDFSIKFDEAKVRTHVINTLVRNQGRNFSYWENNLPPGPLTFVLSQ